MRKTPAILLIVIALLVLVWGVAAAIANPNSITLQSAKVFNDIFEDGDMLFVASYDIAYTAPPATPASDNYIFSLYNSTNTTLLAPVRPVTDYQEDVISIYRTSSQAGSLVWGSNYKVRVGGSPLVFPVGLTEGTNMRTITLSAGDWMAANSTHSSEERLVVWCLQQAEWIEGQANVTLLVNITGGKALNTAGKAMFTTGIPGLDTAVPSLFQTSVTTIPGTTSDPTHAYEEETSVTNMLGAHFNNAFNGIGDYFGVSGQAAAALFWSMIVVMAASIVFVYSGNTIAAMLLSIPLLIGGVYLGLVPMAAMWTVGIVLVAYLGYQMFLVRM